MNLSKKKNFYDFLKKDSNVEEIDVNNHKILTIKRMVQQLQPYCLVSAQIASSLRAINLKKTSRLGDFA